MILEDDAERIIWFKMATIGMAVDITDSPTVAKQLLRDNEYTQIFLDL